MKPPAVVYVRIELPSGKQSLADVKLALASLTEDSWLVFDDARDAKALDRFWVSLPDRS